MGLRMFVEPDVAAARTLAKGDPTAPARSTIRRQRAPRISANTRSEHAPPPSFQTHVRRQTGRETRARYHAERTSLEDLRRRNGDSGHRAFRGAAMDDMSSLERIFLQNTRSGIQTSDVGDEQVLRPSGSAALHMRQPVGALDHQRLEHLQGNNYAQRTSIPRENPHRMPSIRRLQDGPTLTPGRHSNSDMASSVFLNRSPPRNHTNQYLGSAAYTPGFPPAHQLDSHRSSSRRSARMVELASLANQARDLRELPQHSQNSSLQAVLSQLTSMMGRSSAVLSPAYLRIEMQMICSIRNHLIQVEAGSLSDQAHPGSEGAEAVHLPPLHRMSRHLSVPETSNFSNRNPSRQGNLDGLGDRERSLSPEAISWETMLTTITPDDRIPSTHSSFTSATISDSMDSLESTSTSASSRTHHTDSPLALPNEPCPLGEWSGSLNAFQAGTRSEMGSSHLQETIRDFLSHANDHLDRIELLSRRLAQSRSQGQSEAQHGSTLGHYEELQSLEITLQRLESYVQQERSSNLGFWTSPDGGRTGRERL